MPDRQAGSELIYVQPDYTTHILPSTSCTASPFVRHSKGIPFKVKSFLALCTFYRVWWQCRSCAFHAGAKPSEHSKASPLPRFWNEFASQFWGEHERTALVQRLVPSVGGAPLEIPRQDIEDQSPNPPRTEGLCPSLLFILKRSITGMRLRTASRVPSRRRRGDCADAGTICRKEESADQGGAR